MESVGRRRKSHEMWAREIEMKFHYPQGNGCGRQTTKICRKVKPLRSLAACVITVNHFTIDQDVKCPKKNIIIIFIEKPLN
jgi:hypothetical protein